MIYSLLNKVEIYMPPHFAISEAFIVLAAIYCGWALYRSGFWMASVGVLCFGAAAAVGVYRFPSGHVEALADIHRWAGQMGGLIGMIFITSELSKKAAPTSKWDNGKWVFGGFILASILLVLIKPIMAVPLFLMWLLLGIGAAFANPYAVLSHRIRFALGTSLMLFNVLFLRQASYLHPYVSWHAFHIVIAIWIFVISWILMWSPYSQTTPENPS